jgi:hypothetical protein
MSTEQMTDERMANLASAYKEWAEIIVKAWEQDIQGCTLTSFIFQVEMRYPGCILATREVKRQLEQMNIPIYAVYVGAQSRVILIEIMEGKKKTEKINRELKKKIPVSGWLVVEREHREDGTEEQHSQVEFD